MQQELNPKVDAEVTNQLLEEAKQKASLVSNNQLRVFDVGSPALAILEAVALLGSEVIAKVNQLATTLEDKRLAYFGLSKSLGESATGMILVELDGLYPDNFLIPVGFRFVSENISFVTISDIAIAPYNSTATVTAEALTVGTSGNIRKESPIFYDAIPRVATIRWFEDVKGGVEPETDQEWRNRVYGTLQRRDTLMSETDFRIFTENFLGKGSIAVAIGRLKLDRNSYDNGYVFVFALNSDGTPIQQGQITELSQELNQRAAMALVSVAGMEIITINIDLVAEIERDADPSGIGVNIRKEIDLYMQPGKLPPGEIIRYKALENRVQSIKGVIEGAISVQLNGLAQNVALPNKWTVGKGNITKVSLIRNGVEFEV